METVVEKECALCRKTAYRLLFIALHLPCLVYRTTPRVKKQYENRKKGKKVKVVIAKGRRTKILCAAPNF
jgi:hypothetical protein